MTKFRKSTDGDRIKIKSGRVNLVSSNYISLRESLFNAGGDKISCRWKKEDKRKEKSGRDAERARRRERRREAVAKQGRGGGEETERSERGG